MRLYGKASSPGIAVGRIHIHLSRREGSERRAGTAGEELDLYRNARRTAEEELERLRKRLDGAPSKQAEILEAHRMLLRDEEIEDRVLREIRENGLTAGKAVEKVYSAFAGELEEIDDPIIRERAVDLRDIRDRLTRCCEGIQEEDLGDLPEGTILAAEDLFPSEMALLDRTKVLAIAAEKGSENCHTAILARALGIPAVLGIRDLLKNAGEGIPAAVDAVRGEILLDPSEEEAGRYREEGERYLRQKKRTEGFLFRPGATADGKPVQISVNISGSGEKELAAAEYADGVGLFRTEFLYIDAPEAPDEEAQLQVYRRVLEAFGEKPVIIRTLDIGGDKKAPCLELPREENPFLGLRGLRLCLARQEIFRTQLRALLRASVYGNLQVMFPMVTNLGELRKARGVLEECRRELGEEGIPVRDGIPVGVMIEVPALALIADRVAVEADFASIGTNDLCQYVTASDRMNQEVADCYQPTHPGLLRLIAAAAKAFGKEGKPLSVCGEMGGNPDTAPLLVGLGVEKLSMSASSAAAVKERLARFRREELERAAAHCLELDSAEAVQEYCRRALPR